MNFRAPFLGLLVSFFAGACAVEVSLAPAPEADAGTADVRSESDAGPTQDVDECYALGEDPNFGCTPGCWYADGSNQPYHGPISGNACVRICANSGRLLGCLGTADAGLPAADAPPVYVGPCQPGETRSCYTGPSGTENRGTCHGGTQTCEVTGLTTSWPVTCAGEILPHPSGDVLHDGLDNDCNGWIDDRGPDFDAYGVGGYCIANRGCFWFTQSYSLDGSDRTGFRGCATGGRFRTLADEDGRLHSAMLIKGSGPMVYYYGADRRRHVFPTTSVLASWFGTPDRDVPLRRQAQVCAQVIQISDAELAAVALGDNVTLRPGTVFTGITTHPRPFVVARGRILRQVMVDPGLIRLFPDDLVGDREAYLPDAFFVNYLAGTNVERPSDYSARDEYNTTIDRELGLIP